MKYGNNKYEDIKIAYIGGGSRGWAWGFMSDLAVCEDMCGTVYLYDIDLEAAKKNEKIGNGIKDIEGCKSQCKYKKSDENWMNKYFSCSEKVKIDLFLRYGSIAAAGDRHLAEFCPGDWYLKDKETVEKWGFALTPVSWRKDDLEKRLERSERLYSGEEKFN